jgi:hypothetical protein
MSLQFWVFLGFSESTSTRFWVSENSKNINNLRFQVLEKKFKNSAGFLKLALGKNQLFRGIFPLLQLSWETKMSSNFTLLKHTPPASFRASRQ